MFYVVYLADPVLQAGLDLIRLLANPEEKWPAHVTVRGPYNSEPDLPDNVVEIEGSYLSITGVRDFFNTSQNTVYLACQSSALATIWDKPSYGFSPHLTLYDGPSRPFARRLREAIGNDPVLIHCRVTSLARMVSIKGDSTNRLAGSLESMGVSWLLGDRLTNQDLKRLSGSRRLDLITKIWRLLKLRYDNVPAQLPSRDILWRPIRASISSFQSPRHSQSLLDLAAKAYLETHKDASIDRVIADPQHNAAFLRRAWQLGADVSEYELNRALLRVRKGGGMGPIPTVRRHVVSSAELDNYIWAAEFALRLLQDENESTNGEPVSVDRILCDPSLSYRYDMLARSIVPGYRAMDYRWAALVIRKNYQRRSRGLGVAPVLKDRGRAGSLAIDEFEGVPGLFLFAAGAQSVFAGQARNLRAQLDAIRRIRVRDLPRLFPPPVISFESMHVLLALCPQSQTIEREAMRSQLVHSFQPILNIKRIGAA